MKRELKIGDVYDVMDGIKSVMTYTIVDFDNDFVYMHSSKNTTNTTIRHTTPTIKWAISQGILILNKEHKFRTLIEEYNKYKNEENS